VLRSVGSSDVADAFVDPLHGVLVDVGMQVELPKVLNNSETLSLFRGHAKDWQIVE
jgi:hypothetical protein